MKFSEYFSPTLKDEPADAEIVSHKLMIRSGMIKQASAGIYTWLPLGLRVLKNIETKGVISNPKRVFTIGSCAMTFEDSTYTPISSLVSLSAVAKRFSSLSSS